MVYPENATNKKVTYSSDNEAVAVVDEEGKVTALDKGSAKITVTTEDGSYTATMEIKVIGKPLSNKDNYKEIILTTIERYKGIISSLINIWFR